MRLLTYLLAGMVAAIFVLAIWPYTLVASPNSKVRVVDDSRQPLTGLLVVRSWETSEQQKGQQEAITDGNGQVSFRRVVVHMSLLKRLIKPLLVFVPVPCGPSWEIYGHSEFRIYWPYGYALKFDGATWKRVDEVYQSRDGVCIRDPEVVRQIGHENYVELYFFNKRQDFDYTLTVYRQSAN